MQNADPRMQADNGKCNANRRKANHPGALFDGEAGKRTTSGREMALQHTIQKNGEENPTTLREHPVDRNLENRVQTQKEGRSRRNVAARRGYEGKMPLRSHPAALATRIDAQVAHDLARGRTQNQRRDGIPRDLDVAERAEDVNLGVGEDDPSPRGVLDHEAGLAFVAGETTNRAREVVAVQGLDVFDLEGFLQDAYRRCQVREGR